MLLTFVAEVVWWNTDRDAVATTLISAKQRASASEHPSSTPPPPIVFLLPIGLATEIAEIFKRLQKIYTISGST